MNQDGFGVRRRNTPASAGRTRTPGRLSRLTQSSRFLNEPSRSGFCLSEPSRAAECAGGAGWPYRQGWILEPPEVTFQGQLHGATLPPWMTGHAMRRNLTR